jgi:hypothetical protein
MNKKLFFTVASVLISASLAYAHVGPTSGSRGGSKPSGKLAANCLPSAQAEELNINNTRALIQTGGDMWWDFSNSQYEIPKNSGHTALFSGALWLGGRDVSGQLKVAAQKFRQGGVDFWTGPLSTVDAEISQTTCADYDRHFVTTRLEVAEFVSWYELGRSDAANGTNKQAELFPDYSPPRSLYEWPAHGRDYAPYNEDYNLAPFIDVNNDGEYNPDNGDYPAYDLNNSSDCKAKIVNIYGDQNLWWVFNDKGNVHTETGGGSIGMEIRAQAFAFATNDEVNNMTFYNYELVNRSTFTLADTYFGQWVDADLGCSQDDFVGCDVERGLGYCYNGDNNDEDCRGALGYGSTPPAIGVDFFQGPFQDPDGIDNPLTEKYSEAVAKKGIPYPGIGIGYGDEIIDNERFGMRKFLYHNNNSGHPATQDPQQAVEYYNYLRSLWRDGSRMVYGGDGHASSGGTIEADYMYPGDTDPLGWGTGGNPQPTWTEITAGKSPGDRRFMQSAGPFVLEPGAVNNITVGVVWARATTGDNESSVLAMRTADDKTQALFDNCFQLLNGPDAPDLSIEEFENELILYLNNPITSNNNGQAYNEQDPTLIPDPEDSLSDEEAKEYKTYRFQGYKVYQVVSNAVGANDLNDITKARLIAQVDIEDDVTKIINFYNDPSLGPVPVLEVDGENKGIRTSFKVTQDAFADGDNRLINNRAYYFMALSYAHNVNHKERPYLGSRKGTTGSIKPVSGIPHKIKVQNGGTILNSNYGDGLEITRIEGTGNGGNELRLNDATIAKILENGKADSLTYVPGYGPINVKVVNPLKVKPGVFSLWFLDSTTTGNLNDAYWMLTGSELKDTIYSTSSIKVGTETIIFDLGISLNIGQIAQPASTSFIREENQGILSLTASTSDSSSNWLSGVTDVDGTTPLNWILSGSTSIEDDPSTAFDESVYNDWNYYQTERDQAGNTSKKGFGLDDSQIWERQAGGVVAPFRLTSHLSSNGPIPGYLRGLVKLNNVDLKLDYRPHLFQYDYGAHSDSAYFISLDSINQLNHLSSVKLVITGDKSKWTRCPVFEMQDSLQFSQGNAIRGQLRDAPSVNKEGKAGDPNAAPSTDPTSPNYIGSKGMGWFPGYAINLETGERLNMAFGEDSYLAAENGADMLWNPTSNLTEGPQNEIRCGGMHFIYVFRNNIIEDEIINEDIANAGRLASPWPQYSFDQNKPQYRMPAYDAGKFAYEQLKDIRGYYEIPANNSPDSVKQDTIVFSKATSVFRAGMYVAFPLGVEEHDLTNISEALADKEDFVVNINVQKSYQNRGAGSGFISYNNTGDNLTPGQEYYVHAGPVKHFISKDKDSVFYAGDHFVAANSKWKPEYRKSQFGGNDSDNVLLTSINGGRPLYNFSTVDLEPSFNNSNVAEDALDCIKIVPNPYYAYSSYETDKIDNRVRITCLPKTCTLKFYTINGTLVRTLKKDDDTITFLEWDLKNQARVPISSGVYIIHVDAPGVGETVLKWMGVMRPIDLDNF